MDLKKLGEVLTERIERIGISRAELARRVKMSRSTLWIYERGESPETGAPSRPAKDKLERLAAVLTFTPDEHQTFLAQLLELAGYEELINPTLAQSARSETIPARQRRSGVLATPLTEEFPDKLESEEASTIGQDIDAILGQVSPEERERLREILVAHTRKLAQLIEAFKGNEAK